MKNYINADLYRVFRRVPRWIWLALVFAVIAVFFWPSSNDESTIIELIDLLEQVLRYVPVYIGFIEIIYVFGDDFAGKTAQIAIGTGVKRRQVILAKWFELLIVTAFDVVIISTIALVLSVIHSHSLPAELIVDIIVHIIMSVFATGAYISLVFPIMFAMQNITVAFLIYIMISSGAINKLIGLLGNIKILRRIGIENYTLTNCLTVFRSRLILGSIKIESVLGIVIYVGLALWLTYTVYKNRELEF